MTEVLLELAVKDPYAVHAHDLHAFARSVAETIRTPEEASLALGALLDAYGSEAAVDQEIEESGAGAEGTAAEFKPKSTLSSELHVASRTLPRLSAYRIIILRALALFLQHLPLITGGKNSDGENDKGDALSKGKSQKASTTKGKGSKTKGKKSKKGSSAKGSHGVDAEDDAESLTARLLLSPDDYVLLVLFYIDITALKEEESFFLAFMDGVHALHRRCMPLMFPLCFSHDETQSLKCSNKIHAELSAAATEPSQESLLYKYLLAVKTVIDEAPDAVDSLGKEMKSLREKVAQSLCISKADVMTAVHGFAETNEWPSIGTSRGPVMPSGSTSQSSLPNGSSSSMTNAMVHSVLQFFTDASVSLMHGLRSPIVSMLGTGTANKATDDGDENQKIGSSLNDSLLLALLPDSFAGAVSSAAALSSSPSGVSPNAVAAIAHMTVEAKACIEALLSPLALHPVVHLSVTDLSNDLHAVSRALEDSHTPILSTTSSTTVSLVLRCVEMILHVARSVDVLPLKVEGCSDETTGDSTKTIASSLFAAHATSTSNSTESVEVLTFTLTSLLSHLQNYLLQLQKRMEKTNFDTQKYYSAGNSFMGGSSSSAANRFSASIIGRRMHMGASFDPLRSLSTRRALCRILGIVLYDESQSNLFTAVRTAMNVFIDGSNSTFGNTTWKALSTPQTDSLDAGTSEVADLNKQDQKREDAVEFHAITVCVSKCWNDANQTPRIGSTDSGTADSPCSDAHIVSANDSSNIAPLTGFTLECHARLPAPSSLPGGAGDAAADDSAAGRHAGASKRKHDKTGSGDFGAGFDDEDDEDDSADESGGNADKDGDLTSSSKEPRIASSVGSVTVNALIEMLLLSLQRIEIGGKDVATLHLEGLAEMQYNAAKRAQREEIEREKRIEALGVESIPANKLIFHTKRGSVMAAQGAHTIEHAPLRSMLQRAAFFSAFRSYAHVRGEVEGIVLHTQALISRCLAQLPPMMSDSAMDALLESVQIEVEREVEIRKLMKQRTDREKEIMMRYDAGMHAAAQAEIAALPPLMYRKRIITAETQKPTSRIYSYYQLALQVLFTLYAAQAPVEDASSISILSVGGALLFGGGDVSSFGAGGLFGGSSLFSGLTGSSSGPAGSSSASSSGNASGSSYAAAAAALLAGPAERFQADTTINTEDPIAWLLEGADDSNLGDGADGTGDGRTGWGGMASAIMSGAALQNGSLYAQRKRKRPSNNKENESDSTGASGRGANHAIVESYNSTGNGDSASDGFFYDDSMTTPCPYSHFLCRLLEIVEEAAHPELLLDVLLQCPAITTYVWNYLHQFFCMSTEKSRCVLGMWLLTNIAMKRTVYRRFAVNSLLYFSIASKEYPRRLAIVQLGKLLPKVSDGSSGTAGTSVTEMEADTEKQLISYAKRQVAVIPAFRTSFSSNRTKADGGSRRKRRRVGEDGNYGDGDYDPYEDGMSDDDYDQSAAAHGTRGMGGDNDAADDEDEVDNDETPTPEEIQARKRELKKLSDVLDRHLGLFVMLCARHPKELVPVLLDVYRECGERGNYAMQKLLAGHADVLGLFDHLFKDPQQFLTVVMPHLRRHCVHAGPLVQRILWGISQDVRAFGNEERVRAQQAGGAGAGAAAGGGGRGQGNTQNVGILDAVSGNVSSSSTSSSQDRLLQVVQVLLGHVKAMYERSRIPVPQQQHSHPHGSRTHTMDHDMDGDSDIPIVLHDVRFIAPFFSLIPSKELKSTYLLSLLGFVQVQRQHMQRKQLRQAKALERFRNGRTLDGFGAGMSPQLDEASLAVMSMFSRTHSYLLTEAETSLLVKAVMKEALVVTSIPFKDNVTRGISPVDFLVLLHQAPTLSLQSPQQGDESTTSANRFARHDGKWKLSSSSPLPPSSDSLSMSHETPSVLHDDEFSTAGSSNQAILASSSSSVFNSADNVTATHAIHDEHGHYDDMAKDGHHEEFHGDASREANATTEMDRTRIVPIKFDTCKHVVQICFELTLRFDTSTTTRLYGPKEIKRALQKLMHLKPIPTQTMLTAIVAAGNMRSGTMGGVTPHDCDDFIRFVVNTILVPLARDATWEKDSKLWQGALIFSNRYYAECSQFLVDLPDNVLIQALRDVPGLKELFKEEHGSNASRSHILAALD